MTASANRRARLHENVPQRRDKLLRRRPQRRPRRRFLLFCEGRVTEPEYFRDWKRFLRSPLIEIEISTQRGDPLRLVERAVVEKQAADAAARREGDDNQRFDEVWCVFDVDNHERLSDARRKAKENGISLVSRL
jgi:hypothetical protein